MFLEGVVSSCIENVRSQIKNSKYAKGAHAAVPKKVSIQSHTIFPYFHIKKDEILNESHVLEDIKKGLMSGFEITAVKHKD